MRRGLKLQGLAFITAVSIVTTAFGAGVVTVCDEASLRAALVGGGAVTFAASGTIQLVNTLVITNDTLIDASGQTVAISGNNAVRVFEVGSGLKLELRHLTIQNGFAIGTVGAPTVSGGNGFGAAVLNSSGSFVAFDCQFLTNRASGGAGGAASGFQPGGVGGAGIGGVVYNAGGQVSLTGCSFRGNQALGGDGGAAVNTSGPGGAGGPAAAGVLFSTGGTLSATNCAFIGNFVQGGKGGLGIGSGSAYGGSSSGGVVSSDSAVINLVGCDFDQNQCVGGRGRRGSGPAGWESGTARGGSLQLNAGSLLAIGCQFRGNLAQLIGGSNPADGGAVWASGATGAVTDCLFRNNSALGGQGLVYGSPLGQSGGRAAGGAIFRIGVGTFSITNSTFDRNVAVGGAQSAFPAKGLGGAIYNEAGLNLVNCTLASNSAQGGANFSSGVQGGSYGGSLCNFGGTVTLQNVTIAQGAATPSAVTSYPPIALGGGIYNTNGSVLLRNTVLAYSSPAAGSNCFGTIIDLGHNLSSDGSAAFSAVGSLNNTDPKLGPLANYGGATPTLVLLTGSPAIDGGDAVTFAATDQRGRTRPFGAAPDIGAFESSPPYVIRGLISGATLSDEVTVGTSNGSVTTTNLGAYSLEGLTPGTYSVVPASSNYVFYPTNRAVTVGVDQLDINFKAYRWNKLSLESSANGVLRMAFAGTNGATYRLLSSSNLVDWAEVSSHTVVDSNLFEVSTSVSISQAARFFRTSTP